MKRFPWVTAIFAVIFTTVFALEIFIQGHVDSDTFAQIFVLSSDHLNRWWTWVTSMFSHASFTHLFINTIVFVSFGAAMEKQMDRLSFILLFFVSGFAGHLAAVSTQLILQNPSAMFIGASGAISGMFGYYAIRNPKEKIGFLFIIPMSAMVGVVLFVGVSIILAMFAPLNIGHSAHVSGLFTGLIFAFFEAQRGAFNLETDSIKRGLNPKEWAKTNMNRIRTLFKIYEYIRGRRRKPAEIYPEDVRAVMIEGSSNEKGVKRVIVPHIDTIDTVEVPVDDVIRWEVSPNIVITYKGEFHGGRKPIGGTLRLGDTDKEDYIEIPVDKGDTYQGQKDVNTS